MDLALETLPVVTATVLATCAEASVIADLISTIECDYAASLERRRDDDRGARAATDWRVCKQCTSCMCAQTVCGVFP